MNKIRNIINIFFAASAFCCTTTISAQTATIHKQAILDKDLVPPANYSGIAYIGNNNYAVVSDKESTDGFYIFNILLDENTGKVEGVKRTEYRSSKAEKQDKQGYSLRDIEGIAYRKNTNTFYLCGEGDQRIIEYDENSKLTGKEFNVPNIFRKENVRVNSGFESLSYNDKTDMFWTTTESTIKSDGNASSEKDLSIANNLRLQSFNSNLEPAGQYAYKMEKPLAYTDKTKIDRFVHGVSEICALNDGELIVMERELVVTKNKLNSYCNIRLFLVYPNKSKEINESTSLTSLPENMFLHKEEMCSFKTEISAKHQNLANYEGMCLGPKLKDGRQTLILINDTQNGMKKSGFRLKEYLKVIVFDAD